MNTLGYYDMSHTITCNLATQTPHGNISINKYPHSEHEIEHLLMFGVDRDESIDGWRCDSGYQYWIEKGQIYITVSEACHDDQTLGPYPSFDAAYQAGEEICEGVEDRRYYAHHEGE